MTNHIEIIREEFNRRVSFTAHINGRVLVGKTGAIRYFKSEEAARKAANNGASK